MSFDPTDPCAELQPQIAAYALGETEAAAALLEHIAECPACQRALSAYVQVARMLPYDAPDSVPPPSLRARILTAVEETAGTVADVEPNSAPPSRAGVPAATNPRRWRWKLPAFRPVYGLALAVLVALLAWNISLQRQLDARTTQLAASRANWQTMIVLLNDSTVRWYDVAGDGTTGHFWAAPNGRVGCLVIQGLPAISDDQVFQVWLVRDGEHDSGGVFEAREGNGWILIRSSEPLSNYEGVGVTIEPRGGSDAPTSAPVLQGQIARAHVPTVADRQQMLGLIEPLRD